MADDNSDNRQESEPDRSVDGEITSSFPADDIPSSSGGADADSWVDQWASLFEDGPEPESPQSTQPPTREMPILSPEQPPVGAKPVEGKIPGHPDPVASARRKIPPERSAPTGHTAPPELTTPPGYTDPPGYAAQTGYPSPASPDNPETAEMAAWQKSQERTKRRAKVRANQRKAQVMQRQLPDAGDSRPNQPESEPMSVAAPSRSGGSRANPKVLAAVGGGFALLFAIVAGYLFLGPGSGDAEQDAASPVSVDPAAIDDDALEVGADVAPRGISDLALSTVQLLGLNDDLEPECAGSGVIVKPDGTILTNAHVVTSQQGCEFSVIGVGITVDSSSPSQLLYRADVLSVDEQLDLAVLKIAGPLDEGAAEVPTEFPSAPLGDSDTVSLGDNMRILGYPVIGGETITLTTGTVSGFTAQADVGTRALIKTDATISAGNSGGMAVDPDGRVIGIPTKARASESGPAIDCRPLADTNDDGTVDESDNCVSVGGFLNGIRPINLALPLLAEAATSAPLDGVPTQAEPRPEIDFDLVEISNPRFALGRDGNTPVDEVITSQAGIAELCFFVDWRGIPSGRIWDGVWFVDGVLEESLGFTNQEWTIEEEGRNFWLCAQEQNALGLPAGVYEIGFFLEGELLFVEGIELTDEPVDLVEITWTNGTGGEICELAINPLAESGQAGLNELELGDSIPVDGSRTVELPQGVIVAEAYNCEGEPVADAFDGLEIEDPATFLIGL